MAAMVSLHIEGASPSKKFKKALEAHPESPASMIPHPCTIGRSPRPMSVQADCAADFKPVRMLGQGAFGAVVLVERRRGSFAGRRYAMKVMSKRRLAKRNQAEIARVEREVLRNARHPCLVSLRYAFQSRTRLYLVTDFYAGGSLDARLADAKAPLPLPEAATHAARLALAVAHLHASGVIHRDIKPANVLLDNRGRAALADFGLAAYCDEAARGNSSTFAGTLHYMAPELFLKAARTYDGAVDLWSLGALVFEMCAGSTPFDGPSTRALFEAILHAEPDLDKVPRPARAAIAGLLEKDPRRRDTCERLRSRPFVADALDDALLVEAGAAAPAGGESEDAGATAPYLSQDDEASLCAHVRGDLFRGFSYRQDSATAGAPPALPDAAVSLASSSDDSGAPPAKRNSFLASARRAVTRALKSPRRL